MMKKSLTAIVAGILSCCMLATGCSFSDLVPEEFGVWENYYIYRANVRSKTTGENGEKLVTQVTKEDTTYSVASCADYAFVGDDMYMCLALDTSDFTTTHALVKYNVKDKTQETILLENTYTTEEGTEWVYQAYSIEQTFDDYMLIYGHREGTQEVNGETEATSVNLYYKIAYDGTLVELESFDFSSYTRVSDNYFLKTDYQNDKTSLYCVTWDGEPMKVCDLAENITYQFVEKNGAAGVLLMYWDDSAKENSYYGKNLKTLQFFNVKNGVLETLLECDTLMQWVEVPTNEYFITFDYDWNVAYTTRDHFFDAPREMTTQMAKNCVLYQIEYSENGASLKTAYIFNHIQDFTRIQGVEVINGNRNLYVLANWYESAYGCSNGGHKEQAYKVDLNKGELIKMKSEDYTASATDICYGANAMSNGVSCGTYSYYLQKKEYGITTISKTNFAYLLKRYNSNDGTTDVMQIWKNTSYSDSEEKYCQLMWKNAGGDIHDFIVRNY